MNTNDLARQIADRHDLAQSKAREIVAAVMDGVAAACVVTSGGSSRAPRWPLPAGARSAGS